MVIRSKVSLGIATAVLLVALLALCAAWRPHIPAKPSAEPGPTSSAERVTRGGESAQSDAVGPDVASTAEDALLGTMSEASPKPPSGDKREALESRVVGDAQAVIRSRIALEDEVWLKTPRYEARRDEYRKRAAEMLAAVDASDTKVVIALAQRELDAFWNDGSLASEWSYEHGYLARAILEVATEKNPDNFDLMRKLVDSISSTMPSTIHDQFSQAAIESVAPILEREKDLILSRKVSPSPEVPLALLDWALVATVTTHKSQDTLPAYEWIAANADACGWGGAKPLIAEMTKYARNGGLYHTEAGGLPPTDSDEHSLSLTAVNGRRLYQFEGSPEWRQKAWRLWQHPERYSYPE